MRPPLYSSKTHVPDYRAHFPAVLLGRVLDATTLKWRYAWREVLPAGPDAYGVFAGCRSGSTSVGYALEENNAEIPAGKVVWMRHRDEAGVTHFAFTAPSVTINVINPPPDVGSGYAAPPATLCLSITSEAGCDCLEGQYALVYVESLGYWLASAEVCGKGYEFIYRSDGAGGYELGLILVGTTIGDGFAPVASLPYEEHGVAVTGDACEGSISVRLSAGACSDCDQTIGGSGTLCFGEDLTVVFKNTFAVGAITSVCPVYSDLVAGSGIDVVQAQDGAITISAGTGQGSARVMTGLRIQRETLNLPVGLVVDAPECLENPADCCASGGAQGCCFPRPPDTLWAALLESSVSCDCLLSCVELIYDPDRDAWYGGPVGDVCGVTEDVLLRLKCLEGAYRLDAVLRGATPADEDTVGLSGSPRSGVDPSCDPFLYAWDFSDSEPVLCSSVGTFSYLLSESDCSGGVAGTIETDCCEELLPESLWATFGGALSGIAPLQLTFVSGGTLAATWRAFTAACGGTTIDFICLGPSGRWSLSALGSTAVDMDGDPVADSCSPFLWSDAGTASGTCSGAFTVTVRDSPP